VRSIATGDDSSRRATNESVWSEAGSSQWASSTAHSVGARLIRLATARLTCSASCVPSSVEQRRHQLMDAGVGEPHLRLRAEDPQHAQLPRRLGCVVEQRRLADAGLAADHERPAAPGARSDEQSVDHLVFGRAEEKHGLTSLGRRRVPAR
jgi:hypothetical protein